ncbi:3-hydroxyalkanoate synthetase [Sphingomonas sp. S-NIH.Pt3_0716]|nr:3-hydroxyalkanoate synthetase [Sphingomonas sp. S-NIH.Pt3_0716]
MPRTTSEPTTSTASTPLWPPLDWFGQAFDYGVDALQRAVLFADVKRQRGDQYKAHLAERVPHVLNFDGEIILSGADLPRPVNYGLVRITPPEGLPVDPAKRPVIVVDPRAGHGPGIGGFKPDSEIGAALREGHPCYFIGFTPNPVAGQSVEDVMRAEAAFVAHVGELHPSADGKPVVIGNCQAGWQILMTAAVWPDLFGPIIIAGAPLSYWAGDNVMRYGGGLMGGSWATAMTGDMGAGRFDGAWLVQNFENLDPANTLWKKDYTLYSKVDTEAPRYLGFEKYWGGYVYLNDVEMQYIVDNLFIGNRLATAQLLTSDGIRIDLRNIRSPILVFCSHGDNITPPPQALGWITDLYRNDAEIVSHDQTIIYATHDSIGHLGIFVSASVGRKEHREFVSAIDLIDVLPAGLYQATVQQDPDGALPGAVDDDGQYLAIQRRGIADVQAIVQQDFDSERRFVAARRASEANLELYRRFAQPLVQAMASPQLADWLAQWHPMRLSYSWSSDHPMAQLIEGWAGVVRDNRRPVAPDNGFLAGQTMVSNMMVGALDAYRDARDRLQALSFDTIYGAPLVQAAMGVAPQDGRPPRHHPGDTPEHRAFVAEEMAHLSAELHEGGLLEAQLRAIFHVLRTREQTDARRFEEARRLHIDMLPAGMTLPLFRALVREQAKLLRHDPDGAIAGIPELLARVDPDAVRAGGQKLAALFDRDEGLTQEEAARLGAMLDLFNAAADADRG